MKREIKFEFLRPIFDSRLMIRRVSIVSLMLLSALAQAAPRELEEVIGEYIREGMQNNLALQSETYAVQQAKATLDVARAHYLPELSLDARYTWAHGGRSIDFPLGDMLNPVYSTLNQMLQSQGQTPSFPQIQNQSFPLLRSHEQDTHLSLRQPLYAPAIRAGVKAQSSLYEAAQQQHTSIARQLKRDITVAYLNWLKASHAEQIVAGTHALLAENLRVNESLFKNGKVTQDQPLRARAELLAVEQQLQQSNNAKQQAQSYVNFLLNRSLDSPLEPASVPQSLKARAIDLAQSQQQAIAQRAELQQLEKNTLAAQHQTDVARANRLPTLSLGVDAGIQGDDYGFDSEQRYSTASLVLTWKLFAGGGVNAQIDAANAQARRLAAQRDSAQQQVALQVQQAVDRYRTSVSTLDVAAARADAASAAFRIASRKRDEGVINQTEFLDARTALTTAELNLNLTRFTTLAEVAELDFATASSPLLP